MDPVQISIFGIKGYIFLWIFTLIAMAFFIKRIGIIVKILSSAKPENRFDGIIKRISNFIIYVLGQFRLFKEKPIGLPHFLFFWGFVFYALSFWWNLLRGVIPVLPIPYADEIKAVGIILELFGILVILSILVAVTRRIFFAPPHLQKSFDAAIILSLISILMITLLLGQGFKGRIEQSNLSLAGYFLTPAFAGLSKNSAESLYIGMWWLHIATVLFFLAYIPYSKHMHLLASPFNVFFRNNSTPADLSIKGAKDDISTGASKWVEFTWKDLLNSFSCAECGRCDRACPALNSGLELSPRQVLHHIKEHLYETAFQETKLFSSKPKGEPGNGELIGKHISEEEIWQCTTCMSCMQQCPVLNEHLPVIVSLRRNLVSQGSVGPTVQDMLQKMSRYGNSFGQSDRNRAKWTQALDFKIKDTRKEETEYLWMVGDYASYDSRVQNATASTSRIFQMAGLDFGILYEGEKNSGNDVRRIGEEGLSDILKDKNLAVLKKAKFKTIVTTDPHTYNTLKNEYDFNGSNGGSPIGIQHYTETINRLISNKQLIIKKPLNIRVTYHDPCYLGRYNKVYDEPRKVLKAIGVELIEMPRNRADSYCCGAGGGRIWMEDKTQVKERPAESRIREAVALKDVHILVTACPKDIVMFQDAIKTTGNEEKMVVKDIAELVWEAVSN